MRTERVDDTAIAALRAQLPALEDRLSAELNRYRPGAPHPFRFELVGPIDGSTPPAAPSSDGLVDLAKYTFALSRYVKDIDARARIDEARYDVRIYLALRAPRQALRTLAEGRSEQGGRIGVVEVEIDDQAEGAHLPLVVVAHELMHTLGATDKYDASGRTAAFVLTIAPQGGVVAAQECRLPRPRRHARCLGECGSRPDRTTGRRS